MNVWRVEVEVETLVAGGLPDFSVLVLFELIEELVDVFGHGAGGVCVDQIFGHVAQGLFGASVDDHECQCEVENIIGDGAAFVGGVEQCTRGVEVLLLEQRGEALS